MDEGDVEFFLGVQVTHHEDGSIEFTLSAPGLKDDSNMHDTPMAVKPELPPVGPCQESWNYRSLIGMLTYLANTT